MVSSAASGTVSVTLSVVSDVASTTSAPNSTSRAVGHPPTAVNADGNTGLQVTTLPVSLVGSSGMIYITEIFTKHDLITPWDRFGFKLPETLYSIAYF